MSFMHLYTVTILGSHALPLEFQNSTTGQSGFHTRKSHSKGYSTYYMYKLLGFNLTPPHQQKREHI